MAISLEQLATRFALPFLVSLKEEPFVQKKVHKIPYRLAKNRRVLPIREEDGAIWIAIADPLNLEGLEEVRVLLNERLIEVLTTEEAIEQAIELCYQKEEGETTRLLSELKKAAEPFIIEEGYDLLENKEDSSAIRIVNAIVLEGISQGASDIHFEPQENGLNVRYRIDGVLQRRHAPPKEIQSQIITRIKVMAQLDIAEQRLPQDGRIKLRVGGRTIDFRVSTIPVVYGERIVLRILDKGNISFGLKQIAMPKDLLEAFQRFIHMPEGIVLVTGPTGSGKTTTLYSALMELNDTALNIMTVEDPVEFKLPGMAQIGVNPKINLTFGSGLRHILRQDPDIIMIGEIRDKETAEIAIQASLTGHLVLSTLHTNDAPAAITRLVDMGIEPYLLSSSLIGVLAQRLVRLICPHCKISYEPSSRELSDLGFANESLKLYKGSGCEQCFGTGYKGRRGIYELLEVDHSVKCQLLKSADSSALKHVALQRGFVDLRSHGASLVKEGLTTTDEVLRVTRSYQGSE